MGATAAQPRHLSTGSPQPTACDTLHYYPPPGHPPTPPAPRRGELEERCKYLLAADAISEAEGLEVQAEGVDEEVARAQAQYTAQGLDEFNEDGYRAETLEKLRYMAVMEFLTATVKINTVPAAPAAAA